MRILMISDVYFPRVNGVSSSMMMLRRELQARGHEVTLVVPDYGVGSSEEKSIMRIPARPVWRDPEDRIMHWPSLMARLPDLQARAFDLVHIHTPFLAHYAGVKIARLLKVPVVETYHTFFEEYLFHYIPFLPKFLLRYAARAFCRSQCLALDALVVPSAPMQAVLNNYGARVPTRVIPTGLQLEDFSGGDGSRFRKQHGINLARPLLLYVGRLAHEKNIGFLLRTLLHIRQTHGDVLLILAGEGPAQNSLQRYVHKLGLQEHVRFVGYLERSSALLDCYRAADLFVFSSRTETQGLVLLEAMAVGTPVVGLAVMGTAAVLQQGQGAHIAPDNEAGFAACVSTLLNDASARAELARQGLSYVQNWSATEMSERLLRYYEQILAQAPAARRLDLLPTRP